MFDSLCAAGPWFELPWGDEQSLCWTFKESLSRVATEELSQFEHNFLKWSDLEINYLSSRNSASILAEVQVT